jgi:glycosyltransferase involved in cell wall biosynthesis
MLKVLMIGPRPAKYSGISKVIGALIAGNKNCSYKMISTYEKESIRRKLIVYIKAIGTLVILLHREKYDLAHIHIANRGSIYRKFIVTLILRLNNLAYIVHSHNFDNDDKNQEYPDFYNNSNLLTKLIIKLVYANSSKTILLADVQLFRYKQLCNNLTVLNNPIDCNVYFKNDYSSHTDLNIIFIGDLSKRKGCLIAINAFLALNEKNSCLHICGEGGDNQKIIHATIDKYQDSHQIIRHGFVTEKVKIDLMNNADIFLLPSYAEGFPISILEAMAMSLPLVITPVGGITAWLVEGRNTNYVKPGSVDQLAQKMAFLMSNEEARLEMGKSNRQLAEDVFDVPVVVDNLNKIYRSVVND